MSLLVSPRAKMWSARLSCENPFKRCGKQRRLVTVERGLHDNNGFDGFQGNSIVIGAKGCCVLPILQMTWHHCKSLWKKGKVKNNNGLPSKRNRLHESLTLICTVYSYTQDTLVNNVMWSQKQQSRRHIVAAIARVIEWELSCEQGYTFILRRSLVSLVSGMRAFTVNLSEMSHYLTFTICKPVCMSSHLTFWQLERYR